MQCAIVLTQIASKRNKSRLSESMYYERGDRLSLIEVELSLKLQASVSLVRGCYYLNRQPQPHYTLSHPN